MRSTPIYDAMREAFEARSANFRQCADCAADGWPDAMFICIAVDFHCTGY